MRLGLSGRVLALVVIAVVTLLPLPARAGDPYLRWWTISTPHFRVHYHSGLEAIAQRAATIAERVHQRLTKQVGWAPTRVTHIVLSDTSDSANGSAYGQPYNTIRLYVSAPEDMSTLGDYDDWQVELITHEYTHILQIDNISGLPALVNSIFGKVWVPNQYQPRWILEGLAVAMESEHTNAGRLRSSHFDMYLRADVLEDNFATLDEISQSPRRWPGGDLWYLYGSKFIEWILDTYGPDVFAQVAESYGAEPVPWGGLNRAIQRATSRTYPELYQAWRAFLDEKYRAQSEAIRKRGLREGVRLTNGGRNASQPRFLPAQCSPAGRAELVYFRDDGTNRAGYYRVPADPAKMGEFEIVTRATGSVISAAADCSLVFDSIAPSRRAYALSDLFRLRGGLRAPNGEDLRRERLTTGARAREPDVSPDGTRIAYVTNANGTSTLRIAELSADAKITAEQRLVASSEFDQAYTPRFSPDGRRIAYSAWTRGGFRDVRVVDVASGEFFEVTHDRAIDQQPSWSPDGKTLYFTSDRSGVANVYAYDLESGALAQVTNVINGAYMPQVSTDGKTLVYVGYTASGFDLFSMPLERQRYLEPLAPPERVDGRVAIAPAAWPVSPYNPIKTLGPRSYELRYGTGTFGNALTVQTEGSDAVGLHAFEAAVTFETEGPEWLARLNYWYLGLPFNMTIGLFRNAAPRRGYRVGEISETVTEHYYGASAAVGFASSGEFDGHSASFGMSFGQYSHDSPLGTRVDPWAPVPTEPSSGVISSAHVAYGYSNVEQSLYAISYERGMTVYLGSDFAHPALGSESTLALFRGSVTGYLPLPGLNHHVLALAVSGGSSGGTYARRGLFATGGFADQQPFDVYTSGLLQSGFVLRGFEPAQFIGSNYTLLNAEYRFPVIYVDRGVSTLPVFLQHLSGAIFADYGGAYDAIDPAHPFDVMHLGVGAELWLSAILGYRAGGTLRVGVAHGFGEAAPSDLQTYFVAASAF